jgi:hypothetical protein
MHPLWDSWTFDGNLQSPTFTPSFKHEGVKGILDNDKWNGEFVKGILDNGKWNGEFVKENGKPVKFVCHYILTAGVLNFCADCTHALAGQSVPLPVLPPEMRD